MMGHYNNLWDDDYNGSEDGMADDGACPPSYHSRLLWEGKTRRY
jgi:hypothetical protein